MVTSRLPSALAKNIMVEYSTSDWFYVASATHATSTAGYHQWDMTCTSPDGQTGPTPMDPQLARLSGSRPSAAMVKLALFLV